MVDFCVFWDHLQRVPFFTKFLINYKITTKINFGPFFSLFIKNNNISLRFVDCIKYLLITIAKKLNWSKYIKI